MEEYSDKEHLVLKEINSGKIFVGIRGTDITNSQGKRIKDLGTDILVSMGLHRLGNRYKKSDKLVQKLIQKFGKNNVILCAHSLGSTISSDLSHKYDIESHGFNRGGTHHTFRGNMGKIFHPKHFNRAKKNHVYISMPSITKGFDPLSLGTVIDPMANIHFVPQKKLPKSKQGILPSHSIHHFIGDKPIE